MKTLKPKDYDDLYKTLTEISIPVYKKSANYMKYEIRRFGRQAFRITRDGQTAFTAGLNISRSHGCYLWCNGEIIKTNGNIIQFDGNIPHMTLDYGGGDRYSLVLFTTKVWHSALRKNPHIFPKLQAIGIPADRLHLKLYEPIQQTREERLNEATKTIIKQIKKSRTPRKYTKKNTKKKGLNVTILFLL